MGRPVLRTELCDLLGIEYPVILAGMGPVAGGLTGPVATAPLVAAVSNAGGLGVIGGAGFSAERLREEIRKVRSMTDKPFGVDLLLPSNYMGAAAGGEMPRDPRELIPAATREALKKIVEDLGVPWQEMPREPAAEPRRPRAGGMSDEQMEVVIEEKVPVFASGLGSPAPWIDRLKANGTKVLALVGNVKNAKRVAAAGVDIVVAQGTEAGGHTGRVATMALVPQVVDAVAPTPVVAAGGIADGRGIVAALALGAIGVWCGTAFLVSEEANQPDLQKQRILAATDEDTRVTRLYSGKTMRNITNPLIEAWEAAGIQALPMGLQGLLIQDLVYSCRKAGREDLLMNAAGQVSGMLNRIRPAADILHDMVAQAAQILARDLPARVTAIPES
ncbi:NAD(P)H-dependent flavin oxidoreductase [Tepidiforma thermophila]|uniref:NAD(P)H-dependent flavin oxidoreductase YrpB (Nitropropane dioxygenase family) n=1 Tax=Tepidiforma thermophila (strain KCTC 52669 / CGMCC 1.13589 / G233) TaxID=2761530 RepID=A0A2A9HI56_TEPT2|nr:nitronate monooxygenase family protein [Tepidiforma thermophila]PFG74790.1 NAD(P)H-dependent flavin oxidoreductase YrpB (nitropropane dioxygenase family) [Tepidiforma thermophila]